jgi:hypothetical protein
MDGDESKGSAQALKIVAKALKSPATATIGRMNTRTVCKEGGRGKDKLRDNFMIERKIVCPPFPVGPEDFGVGQGQAVGGAALLQFHQCPAIVAVDVSALCRRKLITN